MVTLKCEVSPVSPPPQLFIAERVVSPILVHCVQFNQEMFSTRWFTALRKTGFFRQFSNASPRVLTSGLQDIQIPKVRIEDQVFENLGKWENLVSTECAVSGKKFTYKETYRKSKNLNKALRKKLNLQRGDVVALILPNIPEFSIATLGILRAGLVVTTVNPIYTPHEISRQLADSSVKAIITLTDLWKLAKSSLDLANVDIPILTINSQDGQSRPTGAINFSEFTDNELDIPDITDLRYDELAVLPYSSGTTGLPKGVKLTHSNIVANVAQLSDGGIRLHQETTENHQDVNIAVLPMFHIYGFTVGTLTQLNHGVKVVTLAKFTPELYVKALKQHKPHYLYVAPPIALFLANHPSVSKNELGNVRSLVSGGAPLGGADEERLKQKAQKEIHMLQGYGLTESSPGISYTRTIERKKTPWGSVGKPLPNTEVKIVNPDDLSGTPLGPNCTGELLARGPQIMKEYHNRPKETEQAFLDGWLKTGDMAYYTEDGYLFITDRLKELIKVKGFQVAPAELEELIREVPGVADAAVIGIPHAKDGEVPRAYVVPQQGKTVDPTAIKKHVEEKVASYKKLVGGIAVVDAIPKNASGKTLRRQLKLLYEKENQ